MNKMLVAVFGNEAAAFEGMSALRELHKDGDITLYGTVVLVKDASGKVSVKQSAGEGPVGSLLGMVSGGLVGLLGGPAGVIAGASLGTLTGALFDLRRAGIDVDFAEEVSQALSPGKTAVLADIQESWTTPVDTRLRQHGGLVFRRLRSEVIEDQLRREADAARVELAALKADLAEADADAKAAVRKEIDAVERKLKVAQDQARARIDAIETEAHTKIQALQAQTKDVAQRKKAKIEQRIADVKADLQSRKTKLEEAGRLVTEALHG
jgi:uncharacterized membrane protein